MATRPKPSSRENGRHSHGPITQAGKDRARFNAVRHGLRSEKFFLLNGEKPEAFQETVTGHIRRFQPQDEVETCLVIEMARAHWNLFRAFAAETETLEQNNDGTSAASFQPLLWNRTLDLLPRYQARQQLAYQRAIRTLILVRANFPLDPDQPDDPEPEQAAPPEPQPQPQPQPQPVAAEPPADTPAEPITAPITERPEPAPVPDDWPKAA